MAKKKNTKRKSTTAIVRKRKPEENAKIISKLIQEERKFVLIYLFNSFIQSTNSSHSPALSRKLKYLDPIMPVSVEAQKDQILQNYSSKVDLQQSKFTPEMEQKVYSLMTSLSATEIQEFPSHLLMKALPKVSPNLPYLREALHYWKLMHQVDATLKFEQVLLDFLFDPERDDPVPRAQATMIVSSLVDLQEDFRDRVRIDFLKMVLQNDVCQELLGVAPPPQDFPQVTIKAPVPWKCAIQLARNRLDQVLLTCHPLLQAINMLWHELYADLIIVNTKRVQSEIPLDATELTNLIEKCCHVAREVGIWGRKEKSLSKKPWHAFQHSMDTYCYPPLVADSIERLAAPSRRLD